MAALAKVLESFAGQNRLGLGERRDFHPAPGDEEIEIARAINVATTEHND
jgi:hypothetical protein